MNRLEQFADVLDAIPPWRGRVPQGYLADFLGVFTDGRFRTMFGVDPDALAEREVATRAPTIADGEYWFEAVNWVVAAREARERFVMVALGACYGGPAVASFSTEYAPNTFPRLPVREGEHVFTWFARFASVAAHAAYRERLVGSPHWRALAVALGRRVQGPPQVLRLAPTARSRLR